MRNNSFLARNLIGTGTARKQAMMSKADSWFATTTYERDVSTTSAPTTRSRVPEIRNHVVLHRWMTFSIASLPGETAETMIAAMAQTTVMSTPPT